MKFLVVLYYLKVILYGIGLFVEVEIGFCKLFFDNYFFTQPMIYCYLLHIYPIF